MSDTRRNFFKFLGLGAAVAPTVKGVVTLADHESEKFAAGHFEQATPITINSRISRMVDVQDGVIYDRIRFKAGSMLPRRVAFFQNPMGQRCPYSGMVKGLEDTSMHHAGRLNAPSEFLAQQILFVAHPSSDERDLDAISSVGMWEFRLVQKIFSRGPVLLNPPAKAYLAQLVEAGADEDYTRDSRPTRADLPEVVLSSARANRMTGGLWIPSVAWFGLDLTYWQGPEIFLHSDLDLLVGLQGAECRGVQ